MRRDDLTMDLPGVPKKRGRPKTGKAMSGAERMRKLRARRAALAKGFPVTRDEKSFDMSAADAGANAVPIKTEGTTS